MPFRLCSSCPKLEERVPRVSPFVIELSPAERSALESTSRRYTAPYRDVVRARIVLYAATGAENREIARRLELPVQIVSKWRKRFFEERLAGLAERPRTGRRPAFPPSARGRRQGDRV
jgi:transposase-like protein